MEVFKVAPYDQNLMVNGEYLTENHLSLGQLKVLPGSLIFLRVSALAIFYVEHRIFLFRRMNQLVVHPVLVKTMLVRIIQSRDSRGQGCSAVNGLIHNYNCNPGDFLQFAVCYSAVFYKGGSGSSPCLILQL